MRALDLMSNKREQLSHMGKMAREQAHAKGVNAYFIDDTHPDFITEERPDETRVSVDGTQQPGKFAAE